MDPGAKVLVSSGYSNDPVMSDFQQFGFEDVITKPYSLADLSAVLDRVFP
jgi:CheY-like chemotaxis protein